MENCIFRFKYNCKESDVCSQNRDNQRIESIIRASKVYEDDLHKSLEQRLSEEPHLKIWYHRNCVSRYTSKSNYPSSMQHVKTQPAKKLRRSYTDFRFLDHCLYCAEKCDLQKDPKHPDRWKEAYLCRSTVSSTDNRPYKQYILDICHDRSDEWANEVRIRVEGAVADLHAVEARYHKDCLSRFISKKQLYPTSRMSSSSKATNPGNDTALHHVICTLQENKLRIWNSIELFEEYQSHGGALLTRQVLINKLEQHFGDEIIILSSPGYTKLVTFHHQAARQLKIVKDDDDDDNISASISKIAKQVKREVKDIVLCTDYTLDIDMHNAAHVSSDTLLSLLAAISPKLAETLPAVMIGNMVTAILKQKPTDLQVALGILFRDSKSILGYMYDFGITCSYDEVLKFKKSAAVAASATSSIQNSTSMVQIVVDNFDANIHSPNGKTSTHSLAMIAIQPSHASDVNEPQIIPRLKRAEMKLSRPDNDSDSLNYIGQNKPNMPDVPQAIIPEDVKAREQVSCNRARELDLNFFKDIVSSRECPEHNGYNTQVCRDQGHSVQPKTNVVYLPMIDKPPATNSTMMDAMIKAKAVTLETGQEFVVFTADQQLYKIAVHIQWDNPEMFQNFYLRLGGMHLLMSYVGAIGTLMAGSGMADILGVAFGGVGKMLTGKEYPDNVRALRMLTEEILRPIFDEHPDVSNNGELLAVLTDHAEHSRTAKLWFTCLIKPVLNIMQYIRAEREGDWPLHIASVRNMMPLFFAAAHFNYARYGLYYLRTMEQMPEDIREHFMKSEHTMHHNAGLYNGIWSDMAIETTFMRFGHGKSGIIGITLKPETVKTWAYSLHACNDLVRRLDSMRNTDDAVQTHLNHKEETESRKKIDAKDRQVLRDKLELSIDPLNENEHTDALVNIESGLVITDKLINVDKSESIGLKQMEEFEQGWPGSFHETLHRTVKTMASSRKRIRLGDQEVVNRETVYARAMGLQNSLRDFDTRNLMSYELSPEPASMFDEKGMKIATSKSVLMKQLRVDVSSRNFVADATFLDGCAVMWVVPWPISGTVQDYLNNFRTHISTYLQRSHVYLVFDRYEEGSIKEATRIHREKTSASRVFSLRANSRIPKRDAMLTVSSNKKQLIELITLDLMSHSDTLLGQLIVTSGNPIPVEIAGGKITRRPDMRVTHDEADTIVIRQIIQSSFNNILVVADDTDVFVLLCHFVSNQTIASEVRMLSTARDRAMIDINASVRKHQDIMGNLLAAHGLSGCDTVATYFGIGKTTVLKALRSQPFMLDDIGNTEKTVQDAVEQATPFMLLCYGQPKCISMTEARQKLWTNKVARCIGAAPELASLPPTTKAFEQNVARAHLQVAIWRHSADTSQPQLDPEIHGWQ